MPRFSIIVPIYKTEQYLSRCVESIISQSYKNFELILVDDGSPDNCPDLCDAFVNMDNRIKVIHQKNGGVSSARNAGLSIAKGDWIWFVDSDDYIEPLSLQKLVDQQSATLADLYVFNQTIREFHNDSLDSLFEKYYFKYILKFCPWNKLYKRSIITTRNLQFDREESVGEDMLFNIEYYLYCRSVYFVPEDYYSYIIRDNSAMTTKASSRHVQQMRLYRKIVNILQKRITPVNLSILYFMHLMSGINQSREGGLKRSEYRRLIRFYRKDFPFDATMYRTGLHRFLINEQASFLGKIRMNFLFKTI